MCGQGSLAQGIKNPWGKATSSVLGGQVCGARAGGAQLRPSPHSITALGGRNRAHRSSGSCARSVSDLQTGKATVSAHALTRCVRSCMARAAGRIWAQSLVDEERVDASRPAARRRRRDARHDLEDERADLLTRRVRSCMHAPGCRSSRGFCYGTEKAERVASRVAPRVARL